MRYILASLLLFAPMANATLASAVAAWQSAHPGEVFVAYVGDSIVAGYPGYDPGYPSYTPSGNTASNIALQVYTQSGNLATGTNWGVSGAAAAFCDTLTTGILASSFPKYLILQVGINDIQGGAHDWSYVEGNFDSILSKCNTKGTTLIVSEVWPSPLATNAAILAYNTSLRAWAATNGVEVILSHDWVADTSSLSAILGSWTTDGTHPTAAGVSRWATAIYGKLNQLSSSAATWPSEDVTSVGVGIAVTMSANGDTVTIPAGTASWTAEVEITKAITLQGAGIGSTIIQDSKAADTAILSFGLVANLPSRMTGIEFQDGTGSTTKYNGVIQVGGSNIDSRTMRVDHCKFDDLNGTYLFTYTVIGVIDHCEFNMTTSRIPIYVYYTDWDGVGYSDASWASAPNLGSSEFLFIETNTFNFVGTVYAITDAYRGARYVVRYNTIANGYVEAHGTDSGGRERGTRAIEVYHNSFSSDQGMNIIANIRSGTGVLWSNTASGLTAPRITLAAYRTFYSFTPWGSADGTNAWDVNVAGGAFATGTATGGSTTTMVDSGKSWTTNQWAGYSVKATSGGPSEGQTASIIESNTATTLTYHNTGGYDFGDSAKVLTFSNGMGYAIWKVSEVMDQPGRGMGTQLSGASPSVPGGWNDQVDEPFYEWDNAQGGTDIAFSINMPYQIRSGEHYNDDTEMPGYTPYTYPHPLVTGEGPRLRAKP